MLDRGHLIRKKGGGWLIGVPPEVRRALDVTHRRLLYWILTRRGEVVLARDRKRSMGPHPYRQLARDLAAATNELEAIRKRDERRDRGMYAEGFAHGYTQAYERLSEPHGPSAERGRRRRLYRWAFPDAWNVAHPKQVGPRAAPPPPRPNAKRRRAKRETRAAAEVETVRGPDEYRQVPGLPPGVAAVDVPWPDAEEPQPDPSPSLVGLRGGADTSGAQPPGVPPEH